MESSCCPRTTSRNHIHQPKINRGRSAFRMTATNRPTKYHRINSPVQRSTLDTSVMGSRHSRISTLPPWLRTCSSSRARTPGVARGRGWERSNPRCCSRSMLGTSCVSSSSSWMSPSVSSWPCSPLWLPSPLWSPPPRVRVLAREGNFERGGWK